VSLISETLREQEGDHEVAEDQDAQDQTDQVVGAHSRSTPFRIRKMIRNSTAVMAM
jgi:hypothetical protein